MNTHYRRFTQRQTPTAPKRRRAPGAGRKSLIRPDLNLKEIAAEVGISPSHLSGILRGRHTPTLSVAIQLYPLLGFNSVEELVAHLELYKQQYEAWNRMELTTEQVWAANKIDVEAKP